MGEMDCPTLEQTEREEMQIRKLETKWEAEMARFSLTRRHKTVVVLVLYWNKIAESYLDVDDEIQKLVNVLEDKYNYTILKKSLNDLSEKGRSPQVLLNKYLADAAYTVDFDDSLLIVYYAGHGNPTDDGRLLLTGGNHDPQFEHPGASVDGVVWQSAEQLVYTAKRSDILLIFDCCYAGKLCGTFRRSPQATRNLEFIGATGSNALTKIPGKHSFTSALIWALHELAGDVFTTSELYSKILAHENFPADKQTPVISERGEHSYTRLMLGPVLSESKQNLGVSTPQADPVGDKEFVYGLSLQFTYDKLPTEADIRIMSMGFKNLLRDQYIQAKHVTWGGIRRRNLIEVSPVVNLAAAKLRYGLWARSKSGSGADFSASSLAEIRNQRREAGLRTPPNSTSEISDKVRKGRISKSEPVKKPLRKTKTS